MAAAALPKPGTKYGPCKKACEHRDCAETRRMVAQICHFCNTAIGYDRRFYTDPDNRDQLVHASCLEDAVMAERKASMQS